MKGQLAFEKFGDILPHYILESAPHGTPAPSSDNTSKVPFYQRHSGLVAALICGVLAVGIYLGILFTRPDPTPVPPLGTTAETEVEDVTAENAETEDESTQETPPIDPDETSEEETTDAPMGEIPENFANQHYTVEKIGDDFYLNFINGNNISFYETIDGIHFDSMDDMFYSIRTGDFSERELLNIQNFYVIKEYGYPINNTASLYAPAEIDGNKITDVHWFNNTYEITSTRSELKKSIITTVYNRDSSKYSDGWSQERMSANALTTSFDGIPVAIVHGSTHIYIYFAYTDKETNTEFYATLDYHLTSSVENAREYIKQALPTRIQIYGTRDNVYFDIYVYEFDKYYKGTSFEITKEWVKSFVLQPFTPSRIPQVPELKSEPFEIQEENGKYYLTLPQWDGSIPEAYRPAEGATVAEFHFNSLQEMHNVMSQTSMSLYTQVLFKLNAGEDRRIEIPDPKLTLMPQSMYGKFLTVTLNEDGGYTSRTPSYGFSDGSSKFNVMSYENWQQTYDGWIPTTEKEKIIEVVSTQGTYDDLPCTFYRYVMEGYNHKGNIVKFSRYICHIDLSTPEERKEIFLYIIFSLDELINLPLEGEEGVGNTHLTRQDIKKTLAGSLVVPAFFGECNGIYYYHEFAYNFTVNCENYNEEGEIVLWLKYVDTPTAEDLQSFTVEALFP